MTNGDFVIYRLKDPSIHTNEDNAESKVEFDGDAIVPDSTGSVESVIIDDGRKKADIENALSNETNNQDTGKAPLIYTANVVLDEEAAESLIIDKLADWLAEGTTSNAMLNGQLGIRNNRRSRYNLKPSADSGYKLVRVIISDDERNGRQLPVTIILEHSGDPAKIGTQV